MWKRARPSRFAPWLMALAGWTSLVTLVLTVHPSLGARFLLLGLLFVAVFGTLVLLFRSYYGRHLPASVRRRDPQRPTREGFLTAVFITACAWLQMLRILTLTNGLLLLGVLALIEAFWVSRVE